MPALNPHQMSLIKAQKEHHQTNLNTLISTPFDLNNRQHLDALKKHSNHFELSVNKMYLFQAMSEGVKLWGGSWLWSMVLPLPAVMGTLLNYSLYLGLTGLILEKFSMNDFHQELGEMQSLYKWAMTHGGITASNAEDKLMHPEIQRMIELIAPLSKPTDIIKWDRITRGPEDARPWMITSAAQYVGSFFSKAEPKNTTAAAKLEALKMRVEKQEMTVGVVEGMKRAAEYFTTSPEFREVASTTSLRLLQEPLTKLRDASTSYITGSSFRPHSS